MLFFFKFKKDICEFLKFTVVLLLFYEKVAPNIQFGFFEFYTKSHTISQISIWFLLLLLI